jgi:hypothetical protein
MVRRLRHPVRTRAQCAPGLGFASRDSCSRQWLPELSRKGTSASGDSKVTEVGLPAVVGLPALTSKKYNTPV